MISITPKTLQDLQFPTVLESLSVLCNTELGKHKSVQIVPFKERTDLMSALLQTSEYLSSFQNNNAIPNHGFDAISYEIKFLGIEDSFLELSSFRKIAAISETSNTLLLFLKKFEEYYPTLHAKGSAIEVTKVIVNLIDDVVDK